MTGGEVVGYGPCGVGWLYARCLEEIGQQKLIHPRLLRVIVGGHTKLVLTAVEEMPGPSGPPVWIEWAGRLDC